MTPKALLSPREIRALQDKFQPLADDPRCAGGRDTRILRIHCARYSGAASASTMTAAPR